MFHYNDDNLMVIFYNDLYNDLSCFVNNNDNVRLNYDNNATILK